MEKTRISTKSLHEVIAEELRNRIWKNELQFGQHLYEIELAREMEVSRSSLREALKTLEFEGLVINKARRGTFVSEFNANDMREINEVRLILETRAAVNAVNHMETSHFNELSGIVDAMKEQTGNEPWHVLYDLDMKFHVYVVNQCGNSRIINLYELILMQVKTFLSRLRYFERKKSLFWLEHDDLLQKLKSRNREAVKEGFSEHIRSAGESMLDLYNSL